MASQGQRYTLCGFSQELDWRPLHFVEPVPAHRICNACGVIPSSTALLPCEHVLCRSCYVHCLLEDEVHACPLDGDHFVEEDAQWIHFPLENLLKRKVKCWNAEHGCAKVLAASEQIKHFCEDCDHHSLSCPECSKVVLRRDVCDHLQSKCRDYAMSTTPGSSQTIDSYSQEMMTAVNASMDAHVGEMKDRLEQVIRDNNGHSDRLDEILHCVNTMKEMLLEVSSRSRTLENVASQTAASISCSKAIQEALIEHGEKLQELAQTTNNSNEAQMRALEDTNRALEHLKENTAKTLQPELRECSVADTTALKKVSDNVGTLAETFGKLLQHSTNRICTNLAQIDARIGEAEDRAEQSVLSATKQKELALNTLNIRRYEFFVKGLKAIEKSAHSEGIHIYKCGNMYMSGYHLSPGVELKKVGQHVFLRARLQLHKGVIDEYLQWPFNEKIRLTIKHPSRAKQCQFSDNTTDSLKCYGRPEESSNRAVRFSDISFRVDELKQEGYVTDDSLHVMWELVPKDLEK
nr:TNF receptor-associated factor 6-like isoform X1 [Dermacentor andersoni]XP_054921099.1 TNF receptor-associated factor 6-like isoform X1 [Dermacentor andersoni]XP_054921100.1 TNF receptor-associated factor 6-like isoform X1 [Dermacentor andersoni]XP_054921102.1 TNF receptor-associated factor 6-like isoform X1 [Dermacentor andersoni]XP_054921103.1 TNF receptor-associated factor 6-like isoform X1 [Dermacentor andersoni]XP_054921104.1 TNF receptor-associated factor 6-like isoform X1 [Dermacento